MKKKSWIIGAICLITLAITGCSAKDTVRNVIEKTYTVIAECEKAVVIVEEKISGSEVWNDVDDYFNSLSSALSAVKVTLVKVAPYVGANLATVSSVDFELTSLNAATEDLLSAIEN